LSNITATKDAINENYVQILTILLSNIDLYNILKLPI